MTAGEKQQQFFVRSSFIILMGVSSFLSAMYVVEGQ